MDYSAPRYGDIFAIRPRFNPPNPPKSHFNIATRIIGVIRNMVNFLFKLFHIKQSEVQQGAGAYGCCSPSCCCISVAVVATTVIVIGVALGVGLGVGLLNDDGDDD